MLYDTIVTKGTFRRHQNQLSCLNFFCCRCLPCRTVNSMCATHVIICAENKIFQTWMMITRTLICFSLMHILVSEWRHFELGLLGFFPSEVNNWVNSKIYRVSSSRYYCIKWVTPFERLRRELYRRNRKWHEDTHSARKVGMINHGWNLLH